MIDSLWGNAFFSLMPTVLVGLIFWVIMRAVLRADKSERKAYSAIEAEERARFEAEHPKA